MKGSTLVSAAAVLMLATARFSAGAQDTSFAGMQARGKMAMGVDQDASIHHFDDLADGGRIQLQGDAKDSAGTRTIRAHMKAIQAAFSTGDFSTPEFVHMQSVPGTSVMAAKKARIAYTVRDLAGGGELRITSSDTTAIRAIHEFLAFQRGEHKAPGHEMHDGMKHP